MVYLFWKTNSVNADQQLVTLSPFLLGPCACNSSSLECKFLFMGQKKNMLWGTLLFSLKKVGRTICICTVVTLCIKLILLDSSFRMLSQHIVFVALSDVFYAKITARVYT
jgi:hypothetical protein